ncbi:MAG: monovalent cation/H+ antiporter subunit D family protein [Anderseniella sp.]|jgi:multicomponent Na+:H+ antiporter subunit D|nr:monovalent cation/H+ antiporter subunit D family protein [Anderseniella sp.]
MFTESQTILLALVIPFIGAFGVALAGRWPNVRETVTLTTAVLLAVNVWSLLPAVYAGGRPELHLVEMLPGLSIAFKVEPLGMLFAALASGLWIVNSVYSIGYMRGNNEQNQTRFYTCFPIALMAAMGIAFSGNLLTLFIFYEVLTISTYPLVAHKGDQATIRSARVYMGILLGTSIGLLLPAMIWTYSLAGTLDFTPGGILEGRIAEPLLAVLLLMYAIGIGKAALMPIHRWLPAAMVAPTPVSALLHAVAVVKAGVFTITKVFVYIFGIDFLFAQPSHKLVIWLACFTIVVSSFIALRQTNLKRLLAYSTIGQLSYVVLAASILKPLSEVGASMHMMAHAFGKITLFFAAGAIYVASKKTDITEMHGIGRRMPWTMAAFAVGAVSMIGMPPTAGFISKWYILGGAIQDDNYLALATLVVSTLLNAAYFLPFVFAAFLYKENVPPKKEHGEAPWPMVAALTLTALLTFGFFLFHQPIADLEAQILLK